MEDPRKRPNLTELERNMVAQWLLQNSNNKQVRRGAFTKAAKKFGICNRTIHNIWKSASMQLVLGSPVHLISKKKGTTHKDRKQLDVQKMKSLSVLERSSLRILASKLNVSKTLVGTWIKEKKIRPHTSAIKPTLTEHNKLTRLHWIIKQLDPIISDGKVKFQKMYNTLHMDEKWFYLTKTADRYYLVADEEEPYRTCKSKRYITKIMFMSVVGRPQFSEDGTCIFDGKIGIFPFTTLEPAQRNSINREKGTLLSKPIPSINHEVMKELVINQIIPTIIHKWPQSASKHIIIQQDNAKPHIKPTDPDFIKAANSHGFNIELVCQPANSPDTNVNDLGFFKAIQTLKDRKIAKGVDELLKNVTDAFEEMETFKLNNVFLTLQGCYTEIMKQRGGNNYKIPHMNKGRHIREGTLPEVLEVEQQLVRDCLEYLNMHGDAASGSNNIDNMVGAFNGLEI